MTLKELRKQKGLTQPECAKYVGMPFRTYQVYECDETKVGTIKYLYIYQKLEAYGFVDEAHGILTVVDIKNICADVFENYEISYCYLFGSYAKGHATETSDVDLLVSTSVTGMKFFELVENLREKLKKKVDVLNQKQIEVNAQLIEEILKDGIKIYG